MPYLNPADAEQARDIGPRTGAELNYLICELIADYLQATEVRYANMAEVIGALEGAKYEVLRRIMGPYEDDKANDSWAGKTVDPFDELRYP